MPCGPVILLAFSSLLGAAETAPRLPPAGALARQIAPPVEHARVRQALAPYRRWLGTSTPATQLPGGQLAGSDPRLHGAVPFRHPNDGPVWVRIDGENLLDIARVVLLNAETFALERELSFAPETSLRLWAEVPAGVTPGVYLIVLVPLNAHLDPAWAAWLVDPPVPGVTQCTPASGRSGSTTSIELAGHALRGVTAALLERDESLVHLKNVAEISDSILHADVPADIDPGDYRIRVLTKGGASFETVAFVVQPRENPPPRITAVNPRVVLNTRGTVLTLRGSALAEASRVEIKQGTTRIALPFAALDDGTIGAWLAPGIPAGVYDALVTTPAGASTWSEDKLVVVDPTSVAILCWPNVFLINGHCAVVAGPKFMACIDDGRLVLFTGAKVLFSSCPQTSWPMGLQFIESVPDALIGASWIQRIAIVAAPAPACGVDFVYGTAGVELFRFRYVLDADGALALSAHYDLASTGAAWHVQTVAFGAVSTPRDRRLLLPAFGGIALDWGALESPRSIQHPYHFDLPFWLVEGPQTCAVEFFDVAQHHDFDVPCTRYGMEALTTGLRATVHKDHLQAASVGPIRLRPASSTWPAAVERYRPLIGNPDRPAWCDDITMAFHLIHAGVPADGGVSGQYFVDVGVAGSGAIGGTVSHILMLVTNGNEEELSYLPEFTAAPTFIDVARGVKAAGMRFMPYFATPGISPSHPLFATVAAHRLCLFDASSRSFYYKFWDANGSGVMGDDPSDYWNVNLWSAPYRSYVTQELLDAQQASASFDAIYLDFCKANLDLRDRNLETGDATDGFGALAAELRSAFAANPLLTLGGEASSLTLVNHGTSFSAEMLQAPGDLERDPAIAYTPATSHPISAYLMRGAVTSFSALDLGAPAMYQRSHYESRLIGSRLGLLPTYAAQGHEGYFHMYHNAESLRAARILVEEGAYLKSHGLAPRLAPDAGWTAPDTAFVYQTSGAPVILTKGQVLRKLICDLYWHFGGRAPSAAEFDSLAAITAFNPTAIDAATCQVRAHFQANPTADDQIETREVALGKILQVFPEYPVP
ncbi:MAG: hypothetical protein U1E76_17705 [Planctomycetota bacterium]